MQSLFTGFMIGMSLIVAIGAQNIWILSQSMAGANRVAIAATCIVCDVLLIVLGVYAANEINELIPSVKPWLTYGGVLMLLYLGFGAALRAIKGNSGLKANNTIANNWKTTVIQALAISLLNPHVYLDTVVLLGNIGALQPSPPLFASGASIGSVAWFGGLTAFSPKLRRWLSSTTKWRIFDALIAAILIFMAYQLLNLLQ